MNKQLNIPPLPGIPLLFTLVILFSMGLAGSTLAQDVKSPKKMATQAVEQSITILQQTQKEQDQWEQEKTQLVLLYEQLHQEKETLLSNNRALTSKKMSLQVLNRNLSNQTQYGARLQKELLPFIEDLYDRLDRLISNDPPFLKEERATRMKTLKKTVHDPEITIAEKYRKVMETLFIEAGYGSTIEVYQDKVRIKTEMVMGNIFRLGRVSLFFLSLDKEESAYFNVSQTIWQPLPKEYLMAIRSAVEIGSKHRPVELLSLPLGRLAKGEDQQ